MTLNHATYQPVAGDQQVLVSSTAMNWPVITEFRTTGEGNSRGPGVDQAHLVCAPCGQSVFTLAPALPGSYQTDLVTLAAGVLRHIREAHCDGGGVLLPK